MAPAGLDFCEMVRDLFYDVYSKTGTPILKKVKFVGHEDTDLTVDLNIVDDLDDCSYFCLRHYIFAREDGRQEKIRTVVGINQGVADSRPSHFVVLSTAQ